MVRTKMTALGLTSWKSEYSRKRLFEISSEIDLVKLASELRPADIHEFLKPIVTKLQEGDVDDVFLAVAADVAELPGDDDDETDEGVDPAPSTPEQSQLDTDEATSLHKVRRAARGEYERVYSRSGKKFVSLQRSVTSREKVRNTPFELWAGAREQTRREQGFDMCCCGGKTERGQAFLTATRQLYNQLMSEQ
jgi:hypothetical protein